MKPTSSTQFDCSRAGLVPPLENVMDDVWALGLPMPGAHIPYSLLYLIRDSMGGIHVVDPGWDSDQNWAIFASAISAIGARLSDIRTLTATHLHPDHLGMAERMRRETGATLLLHRAEQEALRAQHHVEWTPESLTAQLDAWAVPAERRGELAAFAGSTPASLDARADVLLEDGDRLDVPGFELDVVWVPGHTHGSICLSDRARGIVLTGDHLLPTMYAGLGLGGAAESNPLADYFASLERVTQLHAAQALPGHGYRFEGIAARTAQTANHHRRRSDEAARILASDPTATVWGLASRLTWKAGWEKLAGFLLYSALTQTSMHRDYLRLESSN